MGLFTCGPSLCLPSPTADLHSQPILEIAKLRLDQRALSLRIETPYDAGCRGGRHPSTGLHPPGHVGGTGKSGFHVMFQKSSRDTREMAWWYALTRLVVLLNVHNFVEHPYQAMTAKDKNEATLCLNTDNI